jgi:hypothetical protein
MVSDIVLLDELPDSIRKNVQAYVGCISGAEMKDKYLRLIEDAGFEQVKVIDENNFAIENMANDPTAKAIIKTSEMPAEKIKKLANSVASIKVSGIKPAD